MGIYDRIMGVVRSDDPSAAVTAPGAEAVTEPGYLPPLSRELFDQMFPEQEQPTYGTTTTTTSGDTPIYDPNGMQPLQGGGRESPSGTGASTGGGLGGRIARLAISFQGTPYVWGGNSPSGFDCSGFVQYVYRQMGVNLPRISFQQARSGPRVSMNSLRPGDLVAWDNSSRNPGADHISIYLGGGLIAEAPRVGVRLRVRKLTRRDMNGWGVRVL